MRISDEDLIRIYGDRYDPWTKKIKRNKVIGIYYWGDEVDIISTANADDPTIQKVDVNFYNYDNGAYTTGYIKKKSHGKKSGIKQYKPFKWRKGQNPYLFEFTFIDVQQGDATLIRTPERKTILIDGGKNKFVARLLASLFPDTSEKDPLIIDALIITHGDADHFSGLVHLADAKNHSTKKKRIYTKVLRYFHNGLVKTPTTKMINGVKKNRPEREKLGDYVKSNGNTYVTSIFDDPRKSNDLNEPFTEWISVLDDLLVNSNFKAPKLSNETFPIVERLQFGKHDNFDIFRNENIDIKVLGPIVETVNSKPALLYLKGNSGISASHTINGHSIVLKLTYGNVNFLMGGDLNHHSQENLLSELKKQSDLNLASEVLKVPHHGSHEFSYDFLNHVNPLISVVSCGDENSMNEYIHPRANLMAALGMASRKPRPLVFCTELSAFFAYRGLIDVEKHYNDKNGNIKDLSNSKQKDSFHAFQRLVFGAVRIRTDGRRVLVSVESARDGIKEAYAFIINKDSSTDIDNVTLY